jgi:hypothetical protein
MVKTPIKRSRVYKYVIYIYRRYCYYKGSRGKSLFIHLTIRGRHLWISMYLVERCHPPLWPRYWRYAREKCKGECERGETEREWQKYVDKTQVNDEWWMYGTSRRTVLVAQSLVPLSLRDSVPAKASCLELNRYASDTNNHRRKYIFT